MKNKNNESLLSFTESKNLLTTELKNITYKNKLNKIFKNLEKVLHLKEIDSILLLKLNFLPISNYKYEMYNFKIDYDLLTVIYDIMELKFNENMIEISDIVSNLLIKHIKWEK